MRPRRAPPTAERLLEVLRDDLFAPPSWALFTEVRSAVGADVPGLRVADAVAVDTRPGPGLALHGLEVKRTAQDLARELEDPRKAEAIGHYCETFSLVVPAPAKTVVGSRYVFPRAWGLIEVAGPRASWLVHPEPRRAEPPPDGFLKALLRAAGRPVEREVQGEGDAPLRSIGPRLSRDLVRLEGCGHRAPRPLTKPVPSQLPCYACAAGLPADPQVIAAAIDEAGAEELEQYHAQILSRLRHLRPASGPALASCSPAIPEVAAAAGGGR